MRQIILAVLMAIVLFYNLISATSNIVSEDNPDQKQTTESSNTKSSMPPLLELYPGGFESPIPDPCLKNVTLLVMIHSAPNHRAERDAIRSSWASPENLPPGVRVLFLLGIPGLVDLEESQEDVVVANFKDSYRNLTLKSVAMLDWSSLHCPGVNYLLKCDDDVFVNLPLLLAKLDTFSKNLTNEFIVGHVAHRWKPIRDITSKYYMTKTEFGQTIFPNFTTGPAYLMPGGLIGSLFDAALETPWLGLEDVFLTGLVAGKKLGVRHESWSEITNKRIPLTVCTVKQHVAVHKVRANEHFMMLRLSKMSSRSCLHQKWKVVNGRIVVESDDVNHRVH